MADAAASSSGGHFAVPLPPPSLSHAAASSSSGSGHFAVPLPPQSPSLSRPSSGAVPLPFPSPSMSNPVPPPPRSGRPGVRVRTTQVRAPSQGGSSSPGRGSISNVSPDLDDGRGKDMRALREELGSERSLRAAAERKVEQLEDKIEVMLRMEALAVGDVAGPRGSARSAVKALGQCVQCIAREAEGKRGPAARPAAPPSPSGHAHGAAQLGGDFLSPSARKVQSRRNTLAICGPGATPRRIFAQPRTVLRPRRQPHVLRCRRKQTGWVAAQADCLQTSAVHPRHHHARPQEMAGV
jgi:hypothetical protein